jgi:hypothetical protein
MINPVTASHQSCERGRKPHCFPKVGVVQEFYREVKGAGVQGKEPTPAEN